MQQQSQFSIPDAPLPFKSTVEKAHGILNLMALSVRLPLRRNVGKSRVGVLHLAGMTALMLGVSFIGNFDLWSWLFGGGSGDDDNSLRNYALLVLALGIWQRRKRISEFKHSVQPHRMHPGDSWFESFVPLSRKVIHAGLEPALVFILGAVLYYQLDVVALGLWLAGKGSGRNVCRFGHRSAGTSRTRTAAAKGRCWKHGGGRASGNSYRYRG
jgi:hypothetical protein